MFENEACELRWGGAVVLSVGQQTRLFWGRVTISSCLLRAAADDEGVVFFIYLGRFS